LVLESGVCRIGPSRTGTTAVATNPEYVKLFGALGAGSLVVGVALVVLIPFLRKLITACQAVASAKAGQGRNTSRVNGANGMSDIEGKVTRVGVSALGSERVSNGDGYRRSRRLIGNSPASGSELLPS
jgi:hypothetical protein